ncbi:MAG TPA: SDR family NAD(P)-dependent oxidoreductase [Stellaceae bacterium]|nr:SDR family NAD(P)-dependent oxidoreductase [Stellaceae bacterium]
MAAPAKPLSQQHAVVTGGGTGIGAASALALARLGARLTLMGRREDVLTRQAEAIRHAIEGAIVATHAVDVTDQNRVSAAFAEAQHVAAITILVNNAGAAESAPFEKTGLDLLERMLAVNLKAAFACAQAVLPAMLAAKYGRVINIASTAGLTGYAYVTAYVAAKHALVGLTRALALETAKRGVTVNAVCPGFTDTDLVARSVETIVAKTGRSAEAARAELAKTNPMGRLVTPEEVASAVAYLALPSASAITGQAIVIAGGEVMG